VIWLWGPNLDPRFPRVIAAMLGAGEPIARVPTAADVDLGNPLAPNDVLVVSAELTSDDIERLHDEGVIAPGDTHFVRMASFQHTASETMVTSIHGRQASPVERYAQDRGYKTRLTVVNDTPEEQIANLLTALGLDRKAMGVPGSRKSGSHGGRP